MSAQLKQLDWTKPNYLIGFVENNQNLLDACGEDTFEEWDDLFSLLRPLATNILRGKKFHLLSAYYDTYINYIESLLLPSEEKVTDNQFITEGNSVASRYAEKTMRNFECAYSILFSCMCELKGKLLVGVSKNIPLWKSVILPPDAEQSIWVFANRIGFYFAPFQKFFTGDFPQSQYDRLLIPSALNWVNATTKKGYLFLENSILKGLGLIENPSKPELERVLMGTFFEKKYSLVPNRPVVIRLENFPGLHQVTLMQKGEYFIALLETALEESNEHFLLAFNPNNLSTTCNTLDAGFFQGVVYPWVFEYLIATLYRDLVTAETVTGKHRFKGGTTAKRAIKPDANTTTWQIIPRKIYIKDKYPEMLVEREKLSEEEAKRQAAIRRYHSVCGHVRHYRDKEGWMAKGGKIDEALADGVILREGETYVKPYFRGVSALDELQGIDLATIPHYLRRGR